MMKTLSNIFKQDKEKFVIPRSVQQVIPIETIWSDGIFKIGRNKFARTYKFTDINYAVASKVDKETMFLEYMDLLNSFDCGGTTKITINNRRLNKVDFEKAILIPMQEDGLDLYRKEYNNMLLDKATSSNSMVQEKYVTVSCYKKTIEEARTYFARVTTELNSHFARLGSKCAEVNGEDKLRILHDFYRTGEESGFHFDIQESMRKGHSFKDYICPDTFEFEKDYFRMGDRYGRVLFLREYASYIKDDMIAELTDMNRNLMLSIDVIPVPTDEAVQQAERAPPSVRDLHERQGGFDPHGFLLQALSEGGAGLRDRRAAEDGAQRQGPAERDGHDDLDRFARRDGRLGDQPGEIIPGSGVEMLLSHRDARD